MKSGADARAVALAYLHALGGTDPSAVSSLVAADFRNEHHAALGSGCVGRDEYARRLPNFFAAFPNRKYDIVEMSVGSLVDAASHDANTAGGSLHDAAEVVVNYRFGADAGDIRIDIPGVMWISVRDGEVTRRLDCWDSSIYHDQTTAPNDAGTGTEPAS